MGRRISEEDRLSYYHAVDQDLLNMPIVHDAHTSSNQCLASHNGDVLDDLLKSRGDWVAKMHS